MSRTRKLSDLIADVRSRTNHESSQFITDSEVTEYLNQALAELWGRLTQGAGHPFYRSVTPPISVTAGTSLYALPADFWQLQGVEATINGLTGPLLPFMSMEHAPLTNTSTPWGMVSPVRYRVQGNMLEFLPPTWTFPATAYYTPACPRLLTGTDTFDGFNGFEVAAIYDTCAVVLAKEESDPSFYMQQRDRIYKHIDSLAATRDQGMPDRVQDVRGDDGIGYGFGDWRFGP